MAMNNINNNWLGFSSQQLLLLSDEEEEECLSPPLPTFFQAHDDIFNTNLAPPQFQEWKQNDQQQTPILEDFLGIEEEQNYYSTAAGGGNMIMCQTNTNQPQTLSLSINTAGAQEEVDTTSGTNKFRHRTSIYRGVTRHRWTRRYEAHLWDNSCRREGQPRKGRQVYLGGYESEEKAARSYDLAALKHWGTTTTTNFPISDYEKELEEMKHMTRQEHVASLRRKSSGFSRGVSIYRGVTRHHQNGRWQARIGRVSGNKDLYLGTFTTQEEAAEAYDVAAIKLRGLNAVTNFEINRYDAKTIMESSTLPVGGGGGAAKRLKDAKNTDMALQMQLTNVYGNGCPTIASHAQPLSIYYPYAHQTAWSKQLQHPDGFDDVHLLQLGSNQGFLHDDHVDSSLVDLSFVVMGNDEGMYGSKDPDYEARNLYHQSSWDGIVKTSFDNNCIPSGRDNTMAVCRGASLNDALN